MTTVNFVPTRKPLVAITFDDGPTPKITDRVTSVLAKNGVKGTFFMTGSSIDANPNMASDIKDAGHEIGIHGYSHKKGMMKWSRRKLLQDFSASKDSVINAVGITPKLFRSPFGNISSKILSVVKDLNMDYAGWSISSKDWLDYSRVEAITRQVIPGSIILFHDGGLVGENRIGRTSLMLDEFLQWARGNGYLFITVSELINQWDYSFEVNICGKRLLGVSSFEKKGKNFVAPIWSVEDVLKGFDFVVSAGNGFSVSSFTPMSNVDNWIPCIKTSGNDPLSIFIVNYVDSEEKSKVEVIKQKETENDH